VLKPSKYTPCLSPSIPNKKRAFGTELSMIRFGYFDAISNFHATLTGDMVAAGSSFLLDHYSVNLIIKIPFKHNLQVQQNDLHFGVCEEDIDSAFLLLHRVV